MSPTQASFLIPMLVFCIYFASLYFNIKMAKKRVSIWKRSSTYMFLRSIGLFGIKTRAKLVWMQELGYDERDAIIIAEYQTRAMICAFVGFFTLGPIAVSFVQH
jgi:hypothetical protein